MYSEKWLHSLTGSNDARRQRDEAAAAAWVAEILQNSKLHSYIQGKTAESIQIQVHNALARSLPSSVKPPSMADYHFVAHPDELKVGRFIRWITGPGSPTAKLSNGGIVVGVSAETNDDTMGRASVQWKSAGARRIVGRFILDACVVFQKLSNEEQLVLTADTYNTKPTPSTTTDENNIRNPFSEIQSIVTKATITDRRHQDMPANHEVPFLLNRNRTMSWSSEDSSSDDEEYDSDSDEDDSIHI